MSTEGGERRGRPKE
ncbi:hypothetical protein GWI33_011162, partial [Rhynchophorus ferrugineus]